MIDRKAMLGVLGMLPDAVLLQALSLAGQSAQPSGMTGFEDLSVDDGSNSITPWQDKTVKYDGGQDRPAMVDKMWAQKQTAKPNPSMQGVPARNLATDSDIYLQTGGV